MTPRILIPPDQLQQAADTLVLDQRQHHYLNQVLRLRAGDELSVFDGQGRRYQSSLLEINRKQAVISRPVRLPDNTSAPAVRLQLVQGIARGDRMDWAIEKATEAGVAAIFPMAADKSPVRLSSERAHNRQAHWQRIAQAACMQCGQDTVPDILPVGDLESVLAALRGENPGAANGDQLLQLAPDASQSLAAWAGEQAALADPARLTNDSTPRSRACVTVIVGPESGFSPSEDERLNQAGVHRVRLGPRILRTETAGIAALSILQAAIGDLK